jgi:hypothetical protein
MTTPTLLPVYFDPGRDSGFDRQLDTLRTLFGQEAHFLPPFALGQPFPPADAVIFPQLLGEAYRRLADFKAIDLPILIITSEFGTVSMWDWELISYLRENAVVTIAPYTVEQAHKVLAAIRVRRELRETKFVVYQDNPGEGQQAPIFKRFYWWENECTQRMIQKFGITLERRSYRDLGARAKAISDSSAEQARNGWDLPTDGTSPRALNSATKLYLAVKEDLAAERNVRAIGINCLNESHFSDSTPCLAWNRLFMEAGIIWGCEGDSVSMLTKYLLHRSLGAPIMMTNLYPFALGNAALKHEKISHFPTVKGDPKNYILVAHCGYLGVVPQTFATQWQLRPKVLAIVDDHATAIDARLPEGNITLAKIHSNFERMTLAEGELEGYAQYPGSDCRNGGVVRVADGHRLLTRLSSHHYLLMTGHQRIDLETIAPVFRLELEII